jgi:hypothetical protein
MVFAFVGNFNCPLENVNGVVRVGGDCGTLASAKHDLHFDVGARGSGGGGGGGGCGEQSRLASSTRLLRPLVVRQVLGGGSAVAGLTVKSGVVCHQVGPSIIVCFSLGAGGEKVSVKYEDKTEKEKRKKRLQ